MFVCLLTFTLSAHIVLHVTCFKLLLLFLHIIVFLWCKSDEVGCQMFPHKIMQIQKALGKVLHQKCIFNHIICVKCEYTITDQHISSLLHLNRIKVTGNVFWRKRVLDRSWYSSYSWQDAWTKNPFENTLQIFSRSNQGHVRIRILYDDLRKGPRKFSFDVCYQMLQIIGDPFTFETNVGELQLNFFLEIDFCF